MAEDPNDWETATRLVRGGLARTPYGEISEALFLTQSFAYDSAEAADRRFSGEDPGFIYQRFGNPTTQMFEDRLALLPDGILTKLSTTGAPFTIAKMMQLKLAAAILSEPRILVMSPLFDMVPRDMLRRLFDAMRELPGSVVYFTNRLTPPALDGYLWLGRAEQLIVPDSTAFDALRRPTGEGPNAGPR